MTTAGTRSDITIEETPQQITSKLPHMVQLDALRAFAVAGVFLHHYQDDSHPTLANMGVKLFFVLSGFLITGILIRSRNELELSGRTRRGALGRFYARRFLRIFPLYYFVVGVAVIVNLDYTREYLVWLLTYTLNIRMAQQGWYIANLAHFWTLAVEEQFYLFWPWIVLLAPRRLLIAAALTMVATGPAYRLYHIIMWDYFDSSADGLRTYIFTLTCFDTLGLGAVLAMLSHQSFDRQRLQKYLTRIALPVGAAGLVVLKWAETHHQDWKFNLVFGDLALALVYCWLVGAAGIGLRGPVGKMLELRPLTYLGKISYGLYVYHPLMPIFCAFLFAQMGWKYPDQGWLTFAVPVAVTIAVASLSWHLMESRINNLKRFFSKCFQAAAEWMTWKRRLLPFWPYWNRTQYCDSQRFMCCVLDASAC